MKLFFDTITRQHDPGCTYPTFIKCLEEDECAPIRKFILNERITNR